MIKKIRLASKCMGERSSGVTKSEENFVKATRAVVSKKNIKAGELITIEHVTTKRPFLENSIPARNYYDIVGKYFAKNDIAQDEIIDWQDVLRVV